MPTPNEARYQVNVDTQQGQKSLEQLGKEVSATNEKFDRIDKTAQGFGGALSVVTNAMGAFGGESAAAAEALTKVQYAMNITAGAKKIAEGSGAMKLLKGTTEGVSKSMGGLKKALLATGIGAVIVAVGALIANFDEIKAYIGEKIPNAGEKIEKVKNVFNGVVSVIKYELLNYLRLIVTQFKTIGNVAKASIGNIIDAVKKAVKGDWGGALESIKSIWGDTVDAVKEGATETGEIFRDMANVSEAYEEGYTKTAREEEKKRAEERRQRAEEQRKQHAQLYNQLVAKYKDFGKSARQLLKEQYDNEIKLAGNNAALKLKIQKKYNEDLAKLDAEEADAAAQEKANQRAQELQDLQLKNAELQNANATAYLDGLKSYEDYVAEKERLDADYNAKYLATLQAQLQAEGLTKEQRLNILNEIANARAKMLEQGVTEMKQETTATKDYNETLLNVANSVQAYGDALAGLFGAMASGMDESSEEYRALMATQTIIGTLAGIAGAIAQGMSMPQPMGAILGAINAATVLATGIINLSKIKEADENTSLSGSAPAASTAGVAQLNAPVLTAQTVTPDSAGTPDTRVYVTETDITKTQKNRDRLKTRVTF